VPPDYPHNLPFAIESSKYQESNLIPLSKRLEFGAESIDAKFFVAAMVSSLKGNGDSFSGTGTLASEYLTMPDAEISVEDRSDWNGNGVTPRTKSRRT
jgi:hypothetical protein